MSTYLQQDLAEAIVKNKILPRYKRKNKKELVVSVGYSAKVAAKKATQTIQAKGVQDALEDFGLTKELITTSLVEDIKAKPRKRLGELTLGADVLGMKEEKPNSKTLIVVISGESAKRYGNGFTS